MAKRWTPTEEKFLLENYGRVPMTELAQRFGVTRKAISAKLDKLRSEHGIRPVASKDKATEFQRSLPPVSVPTPRPVSTLRAAQPRRTPQVQAPESVPMNTPGSKVPSGLFVKTEEGWKPILIDKERITQ
ncbi:MAG: HTH domain-containing protein [bacterium]